MKKIILSLIALLIFGFTNAQTKFGIKGGLNVSNYRGDVGNNSSKIGFHIGGIAEIKLSEKFALQPELLFSTQGAEFNLFEMVQFKQNLSYINIPVMVKYYPVDKFSLEFGPQIGILVSAISIMDDGYKTNIKDSFKPLDFAVDFGTGYDFTKNISAGIRYNLGLSQNFESSKTSNSVFMASLDYKF
ncbi:porin family protein [Flavobacterium sp.]|uniref:porin family protein n=1 Tax=Flavobacterium sp. TaxID=239 RepID=UPI003752E76D